MEILTAHKDALKTQKISVLRDPNELRYKDEAAVKKALQDGEIIPELARVVVDKTQTITQQFLLYSKGGGFWNVAKERKFDRAFLAAIKELGI